jgi:endo-1,4-beta-D-glucanase Y
MPVRLPRRAMWLVLVLVLVLAVSVAGCTGSSGDGASAPSHAGHGLAAAFLAHYVRPDGRVARPDQGNDTVSEGQAYGLLLAEAAGEPGVFGRIWRWTQDHLQLPSGLFGYHANPAGQLLSTQPAADADLLIAWALLRYQGPDSTAWHLAGRKVAATVLAYEVTVRPDGMPVLTAGPWATGRPASLDPSYWALPALTGLARLTGDRRWQLLASAAVTLIGRLTGGGRELPPDWAQLTAAGVLAPVPAPNGSEPRPEYGLDAERTIAWFAVSCDPRARALAARWWALLRQPGRAQALVLGLGGGVLDAAAGPLPLVAAAAAARAAGQQAASRQLLQRAATQQLNHPTYYGGAWAALGPALFSGALGSAC